MLRLVEDLAADWRNARIERSALRAAAIHYIGDFHIIGKSSRTVNCRRANGRWCRGHARSATFERTKLSDEAQSTMASGIVAIAGRNAPTISLSIRAIVVSPMPAQTRFVAP